MPHAKGNTTHILITVFVTGASVLMLEILGTRIIGPHYGVSLYVWSALISVTLGFLAIGYHSGGKLADKKPSFTSLNWILFTAGITVLVLYFISLPVIKLCQTMGLRLGSLVSSIILFGPSITLLGMVIPLSVKLTTSEIDTLGSSAGRIYAVSTLGSVAGTLAVGFLLVPNLSLRQIFFLVALLLFLVSGAGHLLQKHFAASFLNVLLIAMCLLGFFTKENVTETSTPGLIHHTQSTYGTLEVLESANERLLVIDGVVHTAIPKAEDIVSKKGYALTQKYYLELLPYYNPHGTNALLIGLGGGLIQNILCGYGINVQSVEIDSEVVHIARKFFGFEGEVWIGDGRYYIQNAKEKYDFVILDAYASDTIPFHMLTKEMFKSIRDILEERGILAINYVGFPQKTITKSLYRTLKTIFPHIHVYRSEEGDAIQFMYFFASRSNLSLDGFFPEIEQIESISKDRLFYREEQGIIITDSFNPVEFWWIETSSAWRNKTQEVLP